MTILTVQYSNIINIDSGQIFIQWSTMVTGNILKTNMSIVIFLMYIYVKVNTVPHIYSTSVIHIIIENQLFSHTKLYLKNIGRFPSI